MSEEVKIDSKVMINGKEYEISPLRNKHLRAITEMVEQPAPTSIWATLARWLPFIKASIEVKNNSFNAVELDELTLAETIAIWQKISAISGIKITSPGEEIPAE